MSDNSKSDATYYKKFSYEWNKACYKLNPTDEIRQRLKESERAINGKKRC